MRTRRLLGGATDPVCLLTLAGRRGEGWETAVRLPSLPLLHGRGNDGGRVQTRSPLGRHTSAPRAREGGGARCRGG